MKVSVVFILLILATFILNTLAYKFFKTHWNPWLGYGIPALVMVLFMVTVSEPALLFADFDAGYYPAGRSILQNPSALYVIPERKTMPGFVNIPIIALFFTPLSFLSLGQAHFLLVLLSILAVVVSCYWLVQITNVSGWKRIALIGLFVINGPLYNSLREGNSTHFVLLLLVAGLFCVQAKREIGLGVLLAIAALIKIPLFLFGVYYLLRRRWQVLAGLGSTLLLMVAASVILFGVDLHMTWFEQCIQRYAGKPMAAFNIQSVDGFVARLLTHDHLTNWLPLEVGWEFKVIRYALICLLVGVTIWVLWRAKQPKTQKEEYLEFSIALCLALLISPISWTHYYLFLLIPFSLYLGSQLALSKEQFWFNLLLLSTLLISLPVKIPNSSTSILPAVISKLLISHYFFGGVLLLGILLLTRWQDANCSKFLQANDIEVEVARNTVN